GVHDACDAAGVEPPRVETATPEARVTQQLAHLEAVALAVPAELDSRQVADVVRIGGALRDVGESPGEEPQAVSPVRRVRLHPDELPAHPEHPDALRDVVVEVEEVLEVRVADDGVEVLVGEGERHGVEVDLPGEDAAPGGALR